jgi:hypothetical protein
MYMHCMQINTQVDALYLQKGRKKEKKTETIL